MATGNKGEQRGSRCGYNEAAPEDKTQHCADFAGYPDLDLLERIRGLAMRAQGPDAEPVPNSRLVETLEALLASRPSQLLTFSGPDRFERAERIAPHLMAAEELTDPGGSDPGECVDDALRLVDAIDRRRAEYDGEAS